MSVSARLLLGRNAPLFLGFKERALELTDAGMTEVYERAHANVAERETDLNEPCTTLVLDRIIGPTILEVGCGAGYLSGQLRRHGQVTACDLVLDPMLAERYPDVRFETAPMTTLPFPDRSFDTVVSTHTLEHVLDIGRALSELRRVARRRLVLVVPRQRPYRDTFDLHLHFFPYRHSLLTVLRPHGAYECKDAGGDWFYLEEIPNQDSLPPSE